MGEMSRLGRAGPNRSKRREPCQHQSHQMLLGISRAFSHLYPTSCLRGRYYHLPFTEEEMRLREVWPSL